MGNFSDIFFPIFFSIPHWRGERPPESLLQEPKAPSTASLNKNSNFGHLNVAVLIFFVIFLFIHNQKFRRIRPLKNFVLSAHIRLVDCKKSHQMMDLSNKSGTRILLLGLAFYSKLFLKILHWKITCRSFFTDRVLRQIYFEVLGEAAIGNPQQGKQKKASYHQPTHPSSRPSYLRTS